MSSAGAHRRVGCDANGALSPAPPGASPCRQLLIFPRGNKSLDSNPKTSLYLAVPASEEEPWGWYRRAEFTLTLLSEGGQDIVKGERRSRGRPGSAQAPPCLLLRAWRQGGAEGGPGS